MSGSYDFVEDRTHDGRRYRMLNVLDEFTHECLAIRVARKLKAGPTPQSDTSHRTRGVRARIRRVAGCATPTGSAGHAGATANLKLTFHLDHSAEADQ
jgi:hypothetical protein